MAAGSPRRPRSPPPEKLSSSHPEKASSPPVSELSTSDVATGDGSGSIRGYPDTPYTPDTPDTYGDDIKSTTPVTAAALTTLSNGDNSDSAVSDDDDADGNAASDASDASSVAGYSDSGSERSASDTYYLDMGGEAVIDELGWQDVVKQSDIYRTYGSDVEDGGACPDVMIDTIERVEEPEVIDIDIDIEPTPVVEVEEDDIDIEQVSAVELDDANVDALLDENADNENADDADFVKKVSVRTLPDDDVHVEKRERVETLLEGEDIDVDSVDDDEEARKPVSSVSVSASASDDSVVAVDLSDGEEVLSDVVEPEIPTWAQGGADLTAADLRHALEKTSISSITEVRNNRKNGNRSIRNSTRRKYLMQRLRTVRTALQMVQIETAAKSAEAQLNCGKGKNEGGNNEQKAKYKKELAALSATLDFLAKMALQRAIELENREEGKYKDDE